MPKYLIVILFSRRLLRSSTKSGLLSATGSTGTAPSIRLPVRRKQAFVTASRPAFFSRMNFQITSRLSLITSITTATLSFRLPA